MTKHVFISHAHKDATAASAVVTALEHRGVACWIAPRNVPPGGSYAESILTAIEHSSCFVLIYSEHSNVSSHVLREVERALKFGVNIVPVRFDESTPSKSLDYLLATVHWLAIPAESREQSISKAAERIAEWLTNFLSSPAAPLPQRIQRFQDALVTRLEPTRKNRGVLIAAILLALLGLAGAFATGRIRFPMRPEHETATSKPSSTALSSPVAQTSLLGRMSLQPEPRPVPNVRQPAGYAGISSPPPVGQAYNSTAKQRPAFPDTQMHGQGGQFAPPPPPPGMPMPPNDYNDGARPGA